MAAIGPPGPRVGIVARSARQGNGEAVGPSRIGPP